MGSTLDQVPIGARAAIVRPGSPGDCVLTTPARDRIRRAERCPALERQCGLEPVAADAPVAAAQAPPGRVRVIRRPIGSITEATNALERLRGAA